MPRYLWRDRLSSRCAALVTSLMAVMLISGCSGLINKPSRQTGAEAVQLKPNTTLTLALTSWTHLEFPTKRPSTYQTVTENGIEFIRATADRSASMVRWHLPPTEAGARTIGFSWKVSQPIVGANIASRDQDDSPARLVMAFEGDRSAFSPADAALSELTYLLTGEPMPFATLMYVWCDTCKVDRVVAHSRTPRIRYIELATSAATTYDWQHFKRDIAADFAMAFGEPMGPLTSIGLMTDADNTQSTASALFGAVTLHAP